MPASQKKKKIPSQICTGHRHPHRHPLHCATPLHYATLLHCATTIKYIDHRQVQTHFPIQYFSLKNHVAYCFPRASPPEKPDRCTLDLPLSPFWLASPSCSNTDLEVSRDGWTAQHIVALSTTARAVQYPVRDILKSPMPCSLPGSLAVCEASSLMTTRFLKRGARQSFSPCGSRP